ncbi:MAG: hypothetical protein ACI4MF_10290 [Candidatus Faecivicinus sp.]
METIIVEIYIPAISRSFDFRLPASGRVYDVVDEIIRILEATQQNLVFDKELPMLCDTETGRALDPAAYIAETGIHDSSRLLLV